MAKIFISYRRVDSNAITSRIYERLARAFGKKSVFRDVTSLPLGRDFRGVLREATAECQVMLVVIGADGVNASDEKGKRRLDNPDDFVRLEVETGLQRDEITVIPLLVEGAHMPKAEDLPESIRELVYNNALTIHDDPLFHTDMDSLITAIHGLFGRGRLSTRWLALATTLLTIGVIAAALILTRNGGGITGIATNTPTVSPSEQAIVFNPTDTPGPTLALSNMLTFTPTATFNLSNTPAPTFTPTPTFTSTDTATFTPTPTFTAIATLILTSISTATQIPTVTAPFLRIPTILPFNELGGSGNPVTSNSEWTNSILSSVSHVVNGIDMVYVPAGCFRMGNDLNAYDGSTLGVKDGGWQCFNQPFYISRYEITNDDFQRLGCTAVTPSLVLLPKRPRINITWFEADICAAKITGGRLPTEAEWEYAARGPDALIYPWGNIWNPDNLVWTGHSGDQASDVGSKPNGKSWVGAQDMAGNVWEWTKSLYEPYPYVAGGVREAIFGFTRVLRGGSVSQTAPALHAAGRYPLNSSSKYSDVGFRIVVNASA